MSPAILEPRDESVADPAAPLSPAEVARTSRSTRVPSANHRLPLYVAILCAAISVPISLWIGFGHERHSERAESKTGAKSRGVANSRLREPIQPIVPLEDLNPELMALGKRLFFDRRLSGDGSVSCASCHLLREGGADARRFSIGIDGQLGDVNAPTIYNSVFNFRQFWDGRAATLEDQIDGPIENVKEMGSTWEHVLAELQADPSYESQFKAVFGSGINRDNVHQAIAEYERSLTTPDSRFDLWLRGDDRALTLRELRGYSKFKEFQCISCHQGVNLGGSMYQRLGVMAEYFTKDRAERPSDLGRFNVTGDERDRHVFRVAPLRNVALTAPYFHDGSAKTLEDAVRVMIRDQLGRDVDEADVEDISAFLNTLTGQLPEAHQ